jgi:hypothetical protein
MSSRLIVLLAVLASGCSSKTSIDCQTNADCLQGGIGGTCRPSPAGEQSWCSFPDPGCPGTGERWGVASGDGLAGQCRVATSSDGGISDAGGPPDAAEPMNFAFRFGGVTDEAVTHTTQAADGSLYMVVPFAGTVTIDGQTFTSAGQNDFLLAHLTSKGELLWAKRFGGRGEEEVTAIVATADGAVVALGSFSDQTDLGGGVLTADGPADIFLLKVDHLGTYVWARRYGSFDFEDPAALATNSNGDLFVTGTFQHSTTLGAGATFESVDGSNDIFIVRYSGLDGSTQWGERLGDSGFEYVDSIACSGGNIAIAGSAIGVTNLGHGAVSVTNGAGYVASYSAATGIYNWSHIIDEESALTVLNLHGPQLLSDGSLAACATYHGDVDFGSGTIPGANGNQVLLRYGTSGQLLWSHSFDTNNHGFTCQFLAVDADDRIFFAGELRNQWTFGPDTLTPTGAGGDLFVAQYTKDNEVVGAITLSGPSVENLTSLTAVPQVVVSGSFSNTLTVGDETLSSIGGIDSFVAGRVGPLH